VAATALGLADQSLGAVGAAAPNPFGDAGRGQRLFGAWEEEEGLERLFESRGGNRRRRGRSGGAEGRRR
jgi:hypothetical protein